MPGMLLAGKVAIVTGGGSGIGRASAVRFAAEGAAVVVSDIRGPKADETVGMIADAGGSAVSCRADVARADDVERMVATAVDAFGGLDVLFNNAGTIRPGTAVRLSEEDWDLVMAVNVRSVFLGAKYAVPAMAARGGGAIVSTASVSGLHGDPAGVVYSASKAAVINLTRSLAVDHARQQIRVNCICPGAIDTPPVGRMLADADARARSERAHPLGRIGRPEEIAAAAAWLCSDESSFVTGHALVVDGGLSAQSHLTGMADPRPAHLRVTR
jgi:NAD(P)-dependent dehydrogenase (short-subunit alcohol dehydrogenase family)